MCKDLIHHQSNNNDDDCIDRRSDHVVIIKTKNDNETIILTIKNMIKVRKLIVLSNT